MTFVGFYIEQKSGKYHAFDPAKPDVPIIENVISSDLYHNLIALHMQDTGLLKDDYTKWTK